MTFDIRVSPEIGLTLITLASAKTSPTPTLSIVRITLVVFGSDIIAIARFATFSASNFPMIGETLIATNASHIRKTRTLAGGAIAMLNGAVGSQDTAITRTTVLSQCVSVEAIATMFTIITGCLVQTTQTLSRVQVAVAALR